MAGQIQINISYTIATGNQTVQPTPISVSTPVGAVTAVNLQSGANTITVPLACICAVIQPPVTNNVALTLKGVTGDTGVHISQTQATLLMFDPANLPANFVITAASGTTGNTLITFI